MPTSDDPLIIISDLDGTLLDHYTHQWTPAQAWLTRLNEYQIPVVLCSSKTAAEIIALQREFALEGLPFIAENGAVIGLDTRWSGHPDYPRLVTGTGHDAILPILHNLRNEKGYKFTGISDVDEHTFAEWSGLTPKMATMAKQQEASETLIWRDDDEKLASFTEELARAGLMLLEGGRFWHVLDSRAGKKQATDWLISQYQQQHTGKFTTIGLGNSPSDAGLLDAVDYAVVVKGYNRNSVILKQDNQQRVYRTQLYGPAGWCEGLNHFIADRTGR